LHFLYAISLNNINTISGQETDNIDLQRDMRSP